MEIHFSTTLMFIRKIITFRLKVVRKKLQLGISYLQFLSRFLFFKISIGSIF
ncbi:hypothetical protein LEP1GSC021_3574 [Leptospira noguchii str. 1993005606]|uniref:Uncharacterized protein n=1 Tax=Leptospira noguchii str. 2007001578 TaxID=1049974 RepID=A0ABN0IVX0_9LEPT|nr:hypothetical protein LEP1GSC035_4364 [Leptospira noguchii str. 2007001578]EPE83300.1 hypothetical protein LEP1GSC021_3574 [Leptospira noguchii str. 1993005606]